MDIFLYYSIILFWFYTYIIPKRKTFFWLNCLKKWNKLSAEKLYLQLVSPLKVLGMVELRFK